MGMFSGKRKKIQDEEAMALENQLKTAFRDAVWGKSFRTSYFYRSEALSYGLEWLKVRRLSGGIWSVQKIHKQTEQGQENREALKKCNSFFEALEYCTKYEEAMEEQGWQVDEAAEKTSNLMHYREFAEREGVVFDLSTGMPHPTDRGHIVTDGKFGVGAEAGAIKAYQERLEKLGDGSLVIDTLIGQLPESFMGDPNDVIESSLSRLEEMAAFREAVFWTEMALIYFEYAIECGFNLYAFKEAEFEAAMRAKGYSGSWNFERGGYTEMEWLKNKALNEAEKCKHILKSKDIKAFMDKFMLCYHYARVLGLKKRLNAGELVSNAKDAINGSLKQIEALTKSLGYSDTTVTQLKVSILANDEIVIPQMLKDFISEMQNASFQAAQNLLTQQKTLPAPGV